MPRFFSRLLPLSSTAPAATSVRHYTYDTTLVVHVKAHLNTTENITADSAAKHVARHPEAATVPDPFDSIDLASGDAGHRSIIVPTHTDCQPPTRAQPQLDPAASGAEPKPQTPDTVRKQILQNRSRYSSRNPSTHNNGRRLARRDCGIRCNFFSYYAL